MFIDFMPALRSLGGVKDFLGLDLNCSKLPSFLMEF